MNSYVRLKARSPITARNIPQSEVLFEVKGYPHFIENELVARCFFAVAKPYPSRNVAMCVFLIICCPPIFLISSFLRLNTFLELKIENERLQKRLAELRVRAPSPSVPISGPSTSPVYSLRSSSVSRSSAPSVSLRTSDTSGALGSQHLARLSYDNFGSSATQVQGSAYESLGLHTYNEQYTSASSTQPTEDDPGDDTSRRKKVLSYSTCETCATHI